MTPLKSRVEESKRRKTWKTGKKARISEEREARKTWEDVEEGGSATNPTSTGLWLCCTASKFPAARAMKTKICLSLIGICSGLAMMGVGEEARVEKKSP